jgi:transposase-like protein
MQQSTKAGDALPVGRSRKVSGSDQPDAEMLAFRANFEGRSALDELIRTGAQQMLQPAVNAEVDEFLQRHAERVDEQGRRFVVRNGHLPSRELLPGAGKLEVRQPRVRNLSPDKEQRVTFSPSVLPPNLRKSPPLEEPIPWLYLKGISTGDDASKAFDHFREKYQAKYPRACERLTKDRDVLLTFYDFPAEHWATCERSTPSNRPSPQSGYAITEPRAMIPAAPAWP